MPAFQSFKRDRFIIFGRYPVPGEAKTRLIPEMGPEGAAEFQGLLTEIILNSVHKMVVQKGVEVEFCFDGGSKSEMKNWLGPDAMYTPQVQGDLGTRMYSAFLSAFDSGCRRVILVGTDIPDLSYHYLEKSHEALGEYDIVLVPATDGGYCLVGLNQPTDIFGDIAWSTEKVLEQTLAAADRLNLTYFLLPPLTDIDTIEDMKT